MTKALRITLVVNEFPPEKIAGTAMATKTLAERLSQRGHQVMVVVTTSCPPDKREQIAPAAYELVWLPVRPLPGIGILWRIWHVWRVARRFRPQLIQGQAVSCGLIAAVVGKWLKIPSICYAQGYDVYQASALQKRTEIRWGCRWPDRLLAVTQHLASEINRVVGKTADQILPHAFVMPEDTPDRAAARQSLALSDDTALVLSVGRLERFKGHDLLLQAWPRILDQHPKAALWIAGSGSCRDALLAQAESLGISDSVKLVGHLEAEQVHSMMAAADLFVLPSRSEPFGIVLLEAMAHALPVVASRVGGVPEVVPETALVPSDNASALAEAMLSSLHESFQPKQEHQEHAMAFEWQRQVERFEAIYRELL